MTLLGGVTSTVLMYYCEGKLEKVCELPQPAFDYPDVDALFFSDLCSISFYKLRA